MDFVNVHRLYINVENKNADCLSVQIAIKKNVIYTDLYEHPLSIFIPSTRYS